MNQNISAAETLFSAAHPDIKKITNISALILSLLFCAVGLCLLFFSSKVEDSSSASGPVLLVGGIAFLVAGGIRLMIRKRSLIYVPTGSLVKKGSCFFDAGDLSRVVGSTGGFATAGAPQPEPVGSVTTRSSSSRQKVKPRPN